MSQITQRKRRLLKRWWGRKCAYCDSRIDLEFDHIIPESKGGTRVTNNLVLSCRPCNWSKGDLDLDYFTTPERAAFIRAVAKANGCRRKGDPEPLGVSFDLWEEALAQNSTLKRIRVHPNKAD
jgi:5-methylcytosine-specific restriction endonuclease McrA